MPPYRIPRWFVPRRGWETEQNSTVVQNLCEHPSRKRTQSRTRDDACMPRRCNVCDTRRHETRRHNQMPRIVERGLCCTRWAASPPSQKPHMGAHTQTTTHVPVWFMDPRLLPSILRPRAAMVVGRIAGPVVPRSRVLSATARVLPARRCHRRLLGVGSDRRKRTRSALRVLPPEPVGTAARYCCCAAASPSAGWPAGN